MIVSDWTTARGKQYPRESREYTGKGEGRGRGGWHSKQRKENGGKNRNLWEEVFYVLGEIHLKLSESHIFSVLFFYHLSGVSHNQNVVEIFCNL